MGISQNRPQKRMLVLLLALFTATLKNYQQVQDDWPESHLTTRKKPASKQFKKSN